MDVFCALHRPQDNLTTFTTFFFLCFCGALFLSLTPSAFLLFLPVYFSRFLCRASFLYHTTFCPSFCRFSRLFVLRCCRVIKRAFESKQMWCRTQSNKHLKCVFISCSTKKCEVAPLHAPFCNLSHFLGCLLPFIFRFRTAETSPISALVFILQTTDGFLATLWIHKHLQLPGWMMIISGHFQVSRDVWLGSNQVRLSLIQPCAASTMCLGSVSFSPVWGPNGGVAVSGTEAGPRSRSPNSCRTCPNCPKNYKSNKPKTTSCARKHFYKKKNNKLKTLD